MELLLAGMQKLAMLESIFTTAMKLIAFLITTSADTIHLMLMKLPTGCHFLNRQQNKPLTGLFSFPPLRVIIMSTKHGDIPCNSKTSKQANTHSA